MYLLYMTTTYNLINLIQIIMIISYDLEICIDNLRRHRYTFRYDSQHYFI